MPTSFQKRAINQFIALFIICVKEFSYVSYVKMLLFLNKLHKQTVKHKQLPSYWSGFRIVATETALK